MPLEDDRRRGIGTFLFDEAVDGADSIVITQKIERRSKNCDTKNQSKALANLKACIVV